MRITGPRVWGPPVDMAEAIHTLKRLLELGIDFIDSRIETVAYYCESPGIGFTPWSPVATGQLWNSGSIDAIAKAHHATPSQIALAWLLKRSPVMLPIPGTSKVAHLEENVASVE